MSYDVLWAVYRADGGLGGELAYVVGKLLGTAHCALCDITHGALRKRPAFRALEARLPLPLRLVHLNERSPALARATADRAPCVVGERRGRFTLLLDAADLERCAGSVDAFEQALLGVLDAGTGTALDGG